MRGNLQGRLPDKLPGFLCFFLLILVGSCGLEDYPYIEPVPQSNISTELNYRAIVRIPPGNTNSFNNFIIFYRIYVSNVPESSPSRETYSRINSMLNSDYNYFRSYIESDSLVNSNMETLFRNRNFKYLDLNGYDIERDVLTRSHALGRNLIFDFSSTKHPSLTITNRDGSTHMGPMTLLRSTDYGLYSPRPDLLFVNTPELSLSNNINNTINADVVDKSGIAAADPHYTYAALFIVAAGLDTSSYTNIYSTPALIHVFQLPEQW